MDTTQKTREQTQRLPKQGIAPPPSAQQNNGAVRTAEEQRSAAETSRQRPRQEEASKKVSSPKKEAAKAPAKKAPGKKKQEEPAKKAAPKKPVKRVPAEKDVPDRKRAYGNSKPKKTASDTVADIRKKSQERKAERAVQQGKPVKTKRPKQPTPAVIYTQPATFNRNRLLIQLVTVTAVVLALVFGLSVFFKVEHILVSGNQVYSEWDIKTNSGLTEGEDNLLTFSRPRAGALIKANLPYVDTVRFGIKLPDTVNIIVEEDEVVYAIQDQDGTYWLMSSSGRVVEMGNRFAATSNTEIKGVSLDTPVIDQQAAALEALTMETLPDGETAPITTTGSQRLTATLQILKALEENGIVGDIASVDVSRMDDIILWYGSRYQVNLGDSTNLEYKIACMNDVILQMSEWQSGILDISFTIWPNQVGYTPFA